MLTKRVVLLLSVSIVLIILTSLMLYRDYKEFVFVNNDLVFKEFYMTKEYSKNIAEKNNNFKKSYDSLLVIYNTAPRDAQRMDTSLKLENLKMHIEQFNGSIRDQDKSKIWKRIYSYSNDYNEKNKCKINFGNKNEAGYRDISKEFIQFLNMRYEDIN